MSLTPLPLPKDGFDQYRFDEIVHVLTEARTSGPAYVDRAAAAIHASSKSPLVVLAVLEMPLAPFVEALHQRWGPDTYRETSEAAALSRCPLQSSKLQHLDEAELLATIKAFNPLLPIKIECMPGLLKEALFRGDIMLFPKFIEALLPPAFCLAHCLECFEPWKHDCPEFAAWCAEYFYGDFEPESFTYHTFAVHGRTTPSLHHYCAQILKGFDMSLSFEEGLPGEEARIYSPWAMPFHATASSQHGRLSILAKLKDLTIAEIFSMMPNDLLDLIGPAIGFERNPLGLMADPD